VVNNQILLVDDDEVVRFSLDKVLEQQGFVGTTAANVSEALNHINSTVFDVLLTDLHLPRGGDGLTVVSAMRHFKPKAVTTVLSAFPEMEAAARTILQQTDQVLVKPMEVMALVKAIKERVTTGAPPPQGGGDCRSDPVTLGRGDYPGMVRPHQDGQEGDGNFDDLRAAYMSSAQSL
jgi:DNA-binding NtrC family response regulator